MFPTAEKRFLKFNFWTIVTLFLVISAGGIVRSTGSGMGCPDWPKCFGQIIPPTHISQLPEGYEEHYVEGRIAKNQRFSKILKALGYEDLAYQVANDPNILKHEEFNASKTWTEFINRLVGVIAGFMLILTAFFSLAYIKSKKSIVIWSFLNVILVGIQGWLGSIVVSTNLLPWMISVHMVLALVIVAVSIYTYFLARSMRERDLLSSSTSLSIQILTFFALMLTSVQVILGTEVREHIDSLMDMTPVPDRSLWISMLGEALNYHRIFAYISAVVVLILWFMIRGRFGSKTQQSQFGNWSVILLLSQFITGYIMYHFSVPAIAQTSHLILASLMFGVQFYLLLLLKRGNRL